MKGNELKTLQVPAIVLIVVALAAVASVYYTDRLLAVARQQLAQQETLLKEARNRLYQSGEERELIARYLDRYVQLQRIGFVGDEQRINWLDGLRVANQRAELFGVDYQISEQRAYAYASDFNPGQLALHQSTMKLRFGLLHEADLMRFFNTLVQTGAGVFQIDQCTLRRTETTGAIRFQPNLSAECELSWITARPPATDKKS
ncbi:MAG: hypothetical protein K0R53_734 [Burkholderiales bacterium]|jgi:hypothetical protein|nr:hypothetical protein [Burkholderiales bacterium]